MAGVIKLLILGHKNAFKTDFMVKNDSEQDVEITSVLYSPPQMFVFHICGYFTLLCSFIHLASYIKRHFSSLAVPDYQHILLMLFFLHLLTSCFYGSPSCQNLYYILRLRLDFFPPTVQINSDPVLVYVFGLL